MKRQRIAILTPVGGSGGVQRVITNLANGLSEIGWPVDVLCADGEENLPGLNQNIQLIDLGIRKSHGDLKLIFGYRAIKGRVRSVKYGAMITAPGFAGQIGVLACRRISTKVVIMADNKISLLKELDAMHRLQFCSAKMIYPKADAIVAAHDSALNDIKENLPKANADLVRIYHPLIPGNVGDLMRKEPEVPVPDDAPVIVAAGRLVEEKDFDTLLEAFAIVRAKKPSYLLILGDGPLKTSLEKHAQQLDVQDSVVFAGRVSNVYSIFARSDLFVLSSKREAFGNVLIEALACGLPCVATRCASGGPQEILEDGRLGILVDSGDTRALAQAIEQSLLQKDMGCAMRVSRSGGFGCKSSIEGYSALLERLTVGSFL